MSYPNISSGQLRSHVQNFSQIELGSLPRSRFDRSHETKTTTITGQVVPILADEILPGDTISYNPTSFARITTMTVPLMDNLQVRVHLFFAPNRILWSNWVKLMGEQDAPGDTIAYTTPRVTTTPVTGFVSNTLHDYIGLPVGIVNMENPVAFWHRAYNQIYNRYFRDEDLQNPATVNLGNGPDAATDYPIFNCTKPKDYFTSARPWPQKGTAPTLPLAGTANVYGPALTSTGGRNAMLFRGADSAGNTQVYPIASTTATPGVYNTESSTANTMRHNLGRPADYVATTYAPPYADFSTASVTTTINDLRLAIQIQRMLERDARGGTRYIESTFTQFGVTNPDFRLQYPEYLGMFSTEVNSTAVPQTSVTAATPLGNLAALGTFSHAAERPIIHSFTEHGVLLALMSIRHAKPIYQQGLHRKFTRNTRYDFYSPVFAHLGEQSILNKEIYCDASANDQLVFGYQERWAELRYYPSNITAQMRSNATSGTPLDMWHLSQDFSSLPTLGSTFIQDGTPLDRVLTVNQTLATPSFRVDIHHTYLHTRVMPVFSTPGMMDHF